MLAERAQESIESKNMSEVEALSQMVDSMQSIDLSGTPKDFRVAYWNHTAAWKQVVDQIEQKNRNSFTSLIFGIFGIFSGQADLTLNSIVALLTQKGVDMSQVEETWDVVEATAIKHGARLHE